MSQDNKIVVSWIPLQDYFKQWEFLGRDESYKIAEQIGSIDYLMDVKEKLPNYELIQKFHERVILISLGALFEYGLKKAAQIKLKQAKEGDSIFNTFNIEKEEKKLDEEGMEATINRLSKINLLDENWVNFLHRVRLLRDEVHMDRNRDENIQKWIEDITVSGIRSKIDEFKNLICEIIKK